MSKSDTDSNSESYKSLSDEDSKMLTAKEDDDSTSEVESSDETVDEIHANKAKVAAIKGTKEGSADEEETKEATEQKAALEALTSTIIGATAKAPTPSMEDALSLLKSVKEAESNADPGNISRTKYSRAEKKARRLLIKPGAKRLPNVSRLVMRQGMVLFVIENAEIYKNPRSDTFIVFGEVKTEDVEKQQENILACSQIKAVQSIVEATKLQPTKPVAAGCGEEDAEEGLDEAGIDPTDINLVMTQASTTRAKAVRALKANNNDIVNAIMELTM